MYGFFLVVGVIFFGIVLSVVKGGLEGVCEAEKRERP